MYSYLLTFVLLLVLITTKERLSSALVAYDCSDLNNNITHLSLTTFPSCLQRGLETNVTQTHHHIKVFQLTDTAYIDISHCLIEARHLITRCGITIDTRVRGGFYSEVIPISRDACYHLHETGTIARGSLGLGITIERLLPNQKNIISTVSHGYISSEGKCKEGAPLTIRGEFYDKPVRETILEITYRKTQGILDSNSGRIKLKDGLFCNFLDESCFTPSLGSSYWESLINSSICTGESPIKLIYSGNAIKTLDTQHSEFDTVYSFTNGQSDFALSVQRIRTYCGYIKVLQTEHPLIFLVETPTNSPLDTLHETVKPTDIDIVTQLNSKLMFVMRHVKGQLDRLYASLVEDRCKIEQKVIRNLQTIAYISPNQFAYDYYGKPGYTARVAGEIVHITKCNPVSVVYYPLPGKCYNEIPVSYNNITLFVTPRTKLLTLIGTEISCNPLHRAYFNLDGRWYTPDDSSMIQVTPPQEIRPDTPNHWEFQIPNRLIDAGLYPRDVIDEYKRSLLIPDSEHAITSNLVKHSLEWGPDGTVQTNLVNTLQYDQIQSLRDKMYVNYILPSWGWVRDLGSFTAGFWIIYVIIKFIYTLIINIMTLNKSELSNKYMLLAPMGKILNYMIATREKQMRETSVATEMSEVRQRLESNYGMV